MVGCGRVVLADLALPDGFPDVVNLQVANSVHAGSYGLTWNETFEGYQSVNTSGFPYFQLTTDGFGAAYDEFGAAAFSGSWSNGTWSFTEFSDGGSGGFAGATISASFGSGSGGDSGSVPGPGAFFAPFFLVWGKWFCRSRDRGLSVAR